MLKIRGHAMVHDAITQTIHWPDSKSVYAFINAIEERDRDLAFALEEVLNAYAGRVAEAAFIAGFQCGRRPEQLLFEEEVSRQM